MKALIARLCMLLILGGAGIALAQSSSADDLQKRQVLAARLMGQTGFDKVFDTMADQMLPTLGPQLELMLKAVNAPDALRKEFISRFTANFLVDFKSVEVRRQFTEVVIELLATDYTIEELEHLSAFYATPIAQKMLAKQPAQMNMMMSRGRQIGEQVGRRAAELSLEQMGIGKRK